MAFLCRSHIGDALHRDRARGSSRRRFGDCDRHASLRTAPSTVDCRCERRLSPNPRIVAVQLRPTTSAYRRLVASPIVVAMIATARLERFAFVLAQEDAGTYERAGRRSAAGVKRRRHWMWLRPSRSRGSRESAIPRRYRSRRSRGEGLPGATVLCNAAASSAPLSAAVQVTIAHGRFGVSTRSQRTVDERLFAARGRRGADPCPTSSRGTSTAPLRGDSTLSWTSPRRARRGRVPRRPSELGASRARRARAARSLSWVSRRRGINTTKAGSMDRRKTGGSSEVSRMVCGCMGIRRLTGSTDECGA